MALNGDFAESFIENAVNVIKWQKLCVESVGGVVFPDEMKDAF